MNKNFILWLVVAGLLIAATGWGVLAMTRGIRNNNPGNIRHGASRWQGMSDAQTDPDYVQFNDPVYGIRAMAKLLKNYQLKYGLNTIRGLITRWAPPSENITGAYVDNVAHIVGVDPGKTISVTAHLAPLVKAIITHENGNQPYTDEEISRGIYLA